VITTTIAWRVERAAAAVTLTLVLLLPAAPILGQRAVPPFRVTAVRAMLFYGQTGTFSDDLFGPSAPTLQNVTTGEGQSTAVLVIVEITGLPDSYAPNRRIELTATTRDRVLLSRRVPPGRPGDDGKFHAGFWLYDTGCTPVTLDTRVSGQSENSEVRKTINFKCGD
jgi:hypothetical protein